jgi:NTP pyrophosphatase (non-canonical NTP hydrolase)
MPMMALEECEELALAICKVERAFADRPDVSNTYEDAMEGLVDEMGDVLIAVEALRQYYRIPQSKIDMRLELKLNKRYPAETHKSGMVSMPLNRIFEEEEWTETFTR